ncbi:MAG: NAD-binding protein [Sulfolobales archaeon]|nr:NAD-binding protein [Sulfolobales archaeon]MDW7969753.1 NAD-binding protein [Sulfolobales archaeon]
MRILIVGGSNVAEEFLKNIDLRRNEVTIVDSDSDRCKELSSMFDVYVINKDATDFSLYTSDVNVSDVDSVIALTDRDETNIFVLSVAKAYNIPIRIAKVSDPKIAELIIKLGLGVPIVSPSLTASMIKTFIDSVRGPRLLVEYGGFKLYVLSVSETDKAANKSLKEVELPPNTKIMLIFDGSKIYPPDEDTVLLNGYQLIILTNSSEDELSSYLKG